MTDFAFDIEYFFHRPELIENDLIYAIRNRDEEIRDRVISFIIMIITRKNLSAYPHQIFIEKNIPAIIDLIWANHWETNGWDNSAIYDDDFKTICRTAIYIPFIYMDLLSGEYIMHLLHPDELKLEYRTTCPAKEAGETDESYETRCHADILKSKNGNLLKWIKNFEDTLSISFDQVFPNETKRGKQRKGTIGYQFFDEYGYAAYEINKEDGRPQNLLGLYDEPYVNNIGKIVLGQDVQLLEHCDGVVLFKTVLFQHLCQSDVRDEIFIFTVHMQTLVREIVTVKNTFETYLASVSEKRKLSPASEDSNYREQMENSINWIMKEIQVVQEIVNINDEQSDESSPLIPMEPASLYTTILWKVLLLEARAIIRTIQNTLSTSVKSHSEIEKLHQYLRMNPSLPIGINTWSDFRNSFSEQLDEFFPNATDKDLETLWLLAIKTIIYCDPKRFHLPKDIEIPKKLTQKWLNKIGIEQLPAGGLFATMLLLENAKLYAVRQKETKIWQRDGSVITRKIYHSLLPGNPEEGEGTLYMIIKNLTPEKCTPSLVLQMRQLTREYLSGYKLRDRELLKSREIFLAFLRVYEHTVDKADSFNICRRNALVFLRNLERIIQEIKEMKRALTNVHECSTEQHTSAK